MLQPLKVAPMSWANSAGFMDSAPLLTAAAKSVISMLDPGAAPLLIIE